MKPRVLRASISLPTLIAVAGILVLALSLPSILPARNTGPAETVTIGGPFSVEAALPLLVAEERSLFARHGLSVTLVHYDTGVAAVDALVRGAIDIAGPLSEYALVGQAFENRPVRALASIDRLDFTWIVARKDHGIQHLGDLRGKRIGVLRGTSNEFYLGRMLDLNGIGADEVTVLDGGTRNTLMGWLLSGYVDAVAMAEPHPSLIRERLGDGVVAWSAQGSQPAYSLMLAGTAWLAQHPEAAQRLLRAIVEAEEYMAAHPDEVRDVAERRLSLTGEHLQTLFQHNDFSLSLDMALVIAMEDQARWMLQHQLVGATAIPNLTDFIYTDALQAVSPSAVNIIR